MTKKTGMIVLILGVSIIAFTFVDPTGMGKTPTGGTAGTGMAGTMGYWPPLRVAVMCAGALLGILGSYGIVKKQPEKKK